MNQVQRPLQGLQSFCLNIDESPSLLKRFTQCFIIDSLRWIYECVLWITQVDPGIGSGQFGVIPSTEVFCPAAVTLNQ